MPLLTSVVRTVPGTVAVYHPFGSKLSEEISAPVCGALPTSCNCQPVSMTIGSGASAKADRARPATTTRQAAQRTNNVLRGGVCIMLSGYYTTNPALHLMKNNPCGAFDSLATE